MIHQVELHEFILKCLTDVVYLQMWFLEYASSRTALDQESCEDYFSEHPRFHGRHQQIAQWLWDKSRLNKLNLLKEFAQGSPVEKRQWSRQLSREALGFLKEPMGSLTPHIEEKAQHWQKAGAEFLRQFYKAHLGSKIAKFPKFFFSELVFFSELESATFGRREFFWAFERSNQLSVCPACDIESYSRIDHYFPKALYPHLSCHPFNLVPICNTCNTDYKGETNLLKRKKTGNPRKLEDMFLPYRGYGLGTEAYLKFNLKRSIKLPTIIAFKPKPNSVLREKVEVCRDAFSIPDRWRKKATEIERSVYGEVEKVIQAHVDGTLTQRGSLDIFGIRNVLDGLLCSLLEKQGREAWYFPMTWCLVAWINQEVELAVHSPTPINLDNYELLKDIAGWLKQDTIPHPAYITSPRLDKARSLRKIAAEG
jgi:hypothetical protein